jgi:radical SAM enzyme (TIGR01210 family)
MDPAVLEIVKAQRQKAKNRKRRPPDISTWTQRERYRDTIIEGFNVVLVTRGCRWYHASGCSMCGYSNESDDSGEDIRIGRQLEKVRSRYGEQPLVKVFTSGSFFDERELEPDERSEVLGTINEMLQGKDGTLLVESRPEFISREVLASIKEALGGSDLMVALGLESSNDKVLKESINKGFTFSDYQEAARTIIASGARLKTYLLLKPPFLSETEAVTDCIQSIQDIADLNIPQIVSINPMNIQNYTLVEHLFRRGEYRPPWLWSVVEVLKKGRSILGADSWLLCHPTAGGKSRGPHNCGDCDPEFLEAVQDFSLTNDPKTLEDLDCGCILEYQAASIEYK